MTGSETGTDGGTSDTAEADVAVVESTGDVTATAEPAATDDGTTTEEPTVTDSRTVAEEPVTTDGETVADESTVTDDGLTAEKRRDNPMLSRQQTARPCSMPERPSL